eukprot:2471962-Rhodomonas_salina.1
MLRTLPAPALYLDMLRPDPRTVIVSDTHQLASHAVAPDLHPTLYPAVPSPLPSTVTNTLPGPVLTQFNSLTKERETQAKNQVCCQKRDL